MSKVSVICLTPVKNEAWILERFLKCASIWADYIIIADQNSDDGSREIASRFEKVRLIENNSERFNEPERQKLLLQEARKIASPRLLIALDADEMFTPNIFRSPEWQTALRAPAGTVLHFFWANLRPDMTSYWTPAVERPFGFLDDESEHRGSDIHSTRLPIPEGAPIIMMNDIQVMHYQYTDWQRMESKHRWYQCWEQVNHSKRSAIDIYRQYNHMYTIQPRTVRTVPTWWYEEYAKLGIDMTSVCKSTMYRWDAEVLQYFIEHGPHFFSKQDVWLVDWRKKASLLSYEQGGSFADPRSLFHKMVHRWLRFSQPFAQHSAVRLIDKGLRRFF